MKQINKHITRTTRHLCQSLHEKQQIPKETDSNIYAANFQENGYPQKQKSK